jgi:hypothetical protein
MVCDLILKTMVESGISGIPGFKLTRYMASKYYRLQILVHYYTVKVLSPETSWI